MKKTGVIVAGLLAAVLTGSGLAGCGATQAEPSSSGSAEASPSHGGELTVFAAASLKTTFTELGQRFEASHPGTSVRFTFGGSSDLVTQLQQGAPGDVFASADPANMTKATDDHLVAGQPVTFASNTLEIAVPPNNPEHVNSLRDLTKSGVNVVVCAPQVPCGAATKKVEAAARIDLRPVSEESSVTDVLTKVESGEADAGLVYVTDVKGAGDKVKGVSFPESTEAVNEYPIAVMSASPHGDLGRQFVDLVTGPQGQQVLAAAGFAKP